MPLVVTHTKTLVSPDSGVADKVYGSDYVSASSHALAGQASVAQGGTGLATIANAAILVSNAADSLTALVAGASQSVRRNAGNTAWEAYTAGSSTLDGIAAAAASQAGIANANFNIRWNWAKTSDSSAAFEFGESSAATGGTSTSGVPNQVLGKFSTLAGSTMSPLSVYSRGAHVFSVSPTAAQILATLGSVSNPSYSFANAGAQTGGSGFYSVGADILAAISASKVLRFSPQIFNVFRGSSGSTDALDIRGSFSHGTPESPTAISTGDDLLRLSAYGYVGATNTYQEAASIRFDSTGTISDSATGIGGIIRFFVATVGAEPAEIFNASGAALIMSLPLRLKGYTVAALPAGTQGDKAFVTDALDPTYLVPVVGGGAVVTEVFYDGTNWVCT